QAQHDAVLNGTHAGAPRDAPRAGAGSPQFRSLSFQNLDTPAASPTSRPFFVIVYVAASPISVSPLPPPAVALPAPADAVAAPPAVQPLLMKLVIAAAVLKTISTSVCEAPSCRPALPPPTFMYVLCLVLLSWTMPAPPAPPITKLKPYVVKMPYPGALAAASFSSGLAL